jgi:hypothetical protein
MSSFHNWYYNCAPQPTPNLILNPNTELQPCINNVFSLIRYTTDIVVGAKSNQTKAGTIAYYQTVITNSLNGDRVWTFTMGGNISAQSFVITYQFDPLCFVPNGFDQVRLQGINFYKNGSTTDYEPLQGCFVFANISVLISDAPLVVNIEWDAPSGLLLFNFNLQQLRNTENCEVQYEQFKKLRFGAASPQSFFLNLTIRDAVSALSYDSFGTAYPGGGGGYNPVTPPAPAPEPTPTPAPAPASAPEPPLPPVL